jgi:hypothetical protein
MKQYLTVLLLLASITLAQAQDFQIFRTSAQVQIFQNKQWVPAQKRMALTLSDSVYIPSNHTISILNTANNQIIELTQTGKFCLKKAIDNTVRQSGNILSYTTKNIAQSVSTTSKNKNYNVYGATMRSELATIENNHSLTFQLLQLIQDVKKGKFPKKSKHLALLSQTTDSVRTFCIQNNNKIPYVVNILRIPTSGDPTFCLHIDQTSSEYFFALVAPNDTLNLSYLPFAQDDATYVLVASQEIFDAAWLEIALHFPPQTKAKKKVKVELYSLNP